MYIRVMTREDLVTIADSRTFRSGNSEAVRLPKEVAFGRDVEVTVVRSGDVLTIYPKQPPMRELIEHLRTLPKPGSIEVRDDDIPERPGL
jgi:antitoxin VapB